MEILQAGLLDEFCPHCAKVTDLFLGMTHDRPHKGQIVICSVCRVPFKLDGRLKPQILTDEDIEGLSLLELSRNQRMISEIFDPRNTRLRDLPRDSFLGHLFNQLEGE